MGGTVTEAVTGGCVQPAASKTNAVTSGNPFGMPRSAATVESQVRNVGAGRIAAHQPCVKCRPLDLGFEPVAYPFRVGDDLDVSLLPRGDIEIRRLVDVYAIALGCNVITPGRKVAVKCAAQFRDPDISAVDGDSRAPLAGIGFIVPIEPDPGLAGRNRRNGDRRRHRRLGAAHDRQKQTSRPGCQPTAPYTSDRYASRGSAPAIEREPRDIGLRDLVRYAPRIESAALVFGPCAATYPFRVGNDLDIGLLPRHEVEISRLAEIDPVRLDRDVVVTRRKISV